MLGLANMVLAAQAASTTAPLGTITLRTRAQSAYQSGDTSSRRMSKFHAPSYTPNQAVLSNLTTLRARSRAATRNDGTAKGAINALVRNIIGTGIKPLCQASDPAFRQSVHDLFARWTDESDADGLLDFYGQQTQLCRGWLEGGEMYARLRPRRREDMKTVPLQVQLLEPELSPHTYNMPLANGNKVRAGIEFDPIGRRVAYYFHPTRPGDPEDFDASVLRRVPAEFVIPVYDPLRAGQVRGLPHLTQALVKLHEIDKFDDAVLLRQQIANLFVGFVKRPGNNFDTPINPLTGAAVDSTTERPLAELVPGIFQELDPGDDVTFSDPPDVGQMYPDFMRQQMFAVAAATDVPYEVITGDMSKVNDRTVRVILHEFRRRIQAWQHQVIAFQFCRRVYQAWLERAFLSGALALPSSFVDDPEPWSAVKWMPQAWPYLHPVQDVQASREAIRAGLTSRSAEVSERGEDAEVIDQEQADDNTRADALGLTYDSDGRQRPANEANNRDNSEVPEPQPAGAAA